MKSKNQKEEEAKEQRNLWHINPVTRVVPNRNEYNRVKFRKNKKVYEDDLALSEGEDIE